MDYHPSLLPFILVSLGNLCVAMCSYLLSPNNVCLACVQLEHLVYSQLDVRLLFWLCLSKLHCSKVLVIPNPGFFPSVSNFHTFCRSAEKVAVFVSRIRSSEFHKYFCTRKRLTDKKVQKSEKNTQVATCHSGRQCKVVLPDIFSTFSPPH